jgi:hypothetical protein
VGADGAPMTVGVAPFGEGGVTGEGAGTTSVGRRITEGVTALGRESTGGATGEVTVGTAGDVGTDGVVGTVGAVGAVGADGTVGVVGCDGGVPTGGVGPEGILKDRLALRCNKRSKTSSSNKSGSIGKRALAIWSLRLACSGSHQASSGLEEEAAGSNKSGM